MGLLSSDYIHLFTEAKKLAFEDRAKYYSDPDFNSILANKLISKAMREKDSENSILKNLQNHMTMGILKMAMRPI